MEVQVFSLAFQYLYSIEDFTELAIERYHLGTSTMRVTVARESDSACYLQRTFWIKKADTMEFYSVQQLEVGLDRVTATAYSPHFFAGRYLIKPGADDPDKVEVTGSCDKAAKTWLQLSGINMTCAPVREAAAGEELRLSTDSYRVLADAIEDILSPPLMGVRYTFDSNDKAFVFDTVEVVDKTMDGAAAAGNLPVIFSVRYDNLQTLQYTESALDEVTTVYVSEEAEEEGEVGTITVFGDDVTGYARSEVLVNRGEDDSEPKELAEEAVQKPALSFTAQIYEDDNLLYGVDYDVGDLVTAWVELPGVKVAGGYYDPIRQWVKVDQQITCISEHYGGNSSGSGRSLDITLGQPEKSLPEQVKEIKKKEKKLTADGKPIGAKVEIPWD